MSQNNAADLQRFFCGNKVDYVVNSYQNFIFFYPEEQVVVVPKVTKVVGVNVKSDTNQDSLILFPVICTPAILWIPLWFTMFPS